MKINSISASHILSFRQEQNFSNLARFNLFIGKNGSGKSNVLRLLGKMPFDFEAITELTKLAKGNAPLYNVRLALYASNNNTADEIFTSGGNNISQLGGNFQITYESIDGNTGETLYNEIEFSGGRHVSGAVFKFTNQVEYINLSKSNTEFHYDFLNHLTQNLNLIKILNFALYFIFERHIYFLQHGELGSKEAGQVAQRDKNFSGSALNERDDYLFLASGVFQCAKLIQELLLANDKSIILIDEPELHLEARACRRLFQVLVWMSVFSCEFVNLSDVEKEIYTFVNSSWESWKSDPELYGNFQYLGYDSPVPFRPNPKQLFIASHSNVFINEFLKLDSSATIYEFDSEIMDEKVFSVTRQLNSSVDLLLDNLGCRGSDLLQTNGVIWVEGPSDVILIQKWLDMYLKEQDLPLLKKGIDYEFQIFGGAILDSLCLIEEGLSEEDEQKKLVQMFSFSRNAYVVIDSDAIEREDSVIDNSKFSAAKLFIKAQFTELESQGYNLGLWFPEGNTAIRTLEDYLDEETKTKFPSIGKPTKKRYAQKVVNNWSQEKLLADFPNGLEEQIADLVRKIQSWNI